jgi:virginiamycin B lyase
VVYGSYWVKKSGGPDGALKFTTAANIAIGRISTSGTVTFYYVPSGYDAMAITNGPDGALWFTEHFPGPGTCNGVPCENKIGRITTAGVITEYDYDYVASSSITTGSDGALWFTSSNQDDIFGNNLGRITTSGAMTNSYTIPTPNAGAFGITTGPDGGLWFTEYSTNKIGRAVPVPMICAPSITSGGIVPVPARRRLFRPANACQFTGPTLPAA